MYKITSHGMVDDLDNYPETDHPQCVSGAGDTEADAYEECIEELWYGCNIDPDDLDLPKFWGNDTESICDECPDRYRDVDCTDCSRGFVVTIEYGCAFESVERVHQEVNP